MNKNKDFVDVTEFHHDDQKVVMEQIAKDGVCPFCQPHLATYHHQPILWQNNDWLVTQNDFPYEGSRLHIVLICQHHVEDILKLDGAAYLALRQAISWVVKNYQIRGGTFLMRFGEGKYNGASIRHLHAHIIVGEKVKGIKAESLKVKVGYRKKRG